MVDGIEITHEKLHTHYTKHFTIHGNVQHTLHNHNTNCADNTSSIPLSYLPQSRSPVFPSALHRFVLPYLHPVPPSSFPCCIAPWRRTQMRTKHYAHRGLGDTGSPNHRNYSRLCNSDVQGTCAQNIGNRSTKPPANIHCDDIREHGQNQLEKPMIIGCRALEHWKS